MFHLDYYSLQLKLFSSHINYACGVDINLFLAAEVFRVLETIFRLLILEIPSLCLSTSVLTSPSPPLFFLTDFSFCYCYSSNCSVYVFPNTEMMLLPKTSSII